MLLAPSGILACRSLVGSQVGIDVLENGGTALDGALAAWAVELAGQGDPVLEQRSRLTLLISPELGDGGYFTAHGWNVDIADSFPQVAAWLLRFGSRSLYDLARPAAGYAGRGLPTAGGLRTSPRLHELLSNLEQVSQRPTEWAAAEPVLVHGWRAVHIQVKGGSNATRAADGVGPIACLAIDHRGLAVALAMTTEATDGVGLSMAGRDGSVMAAAELGGSRGLPAVTAAVLNRNDGNGAIRETAEAKAPTETAHLMAVAADAMNGVLVGLVDPVQVGRVAAY